MKNSNNFAQLLTRPSLRDEIDRELAARSLGEFVRQAWPIIEPSTPFVPGWHIDAIIEHLEAVTRGQIRNLLINVPPRHMKSLLVSVFWPAGSGSRWPERRWLYSSYAAQAQHPRFGEMPAPDRVPLVSGSAGATALR